MSSIVVLPYYMLLPPACCVGFPSGCFFCSSFVRRKAVASLVGSSLIWLPVLFAVSLIVLLRCNDYSGGKLKVILFLGRCCLGGFDLITGSKQNNILWRNRLTNLFFVSDNSLNFFQIKTRPRKQILLLLLLLLWLSRSGSIITVHEIVVEAHSTTNTLRYPAFLCCVYFFYILLQYDNTRCNLGL